MMIRRKFLFGSLGVAVSWSLASMSASATEVGDLRRQLRSKLEPRTPAENAFLEKVVRMVEQDMLPRSLVLKTFQWAREKRPYPFPYFRRALKILAGRSGITIE